jgi:hypothetical protein
MTTETTLYWFLIEIYFHSDMHTDVTHMCTLEFECLTHGADAQWRKRWFPHLLGSESSVLLRRSLLDKEAAVVRQSVLQNMKTNKKKYVFCYPNDNK